MAQPGYDRLLKRAFVRAYNWPSEEHTSDLNAIKRAILLIETRPSIVTASDIRKNKSEALHAWMLMVDPAVVRANSSALVPPEFTTDLAPVDRLATAVPVADASTIQDNPHPNWSSVFIAYDMILPLMMEATLDKTVYETGDDVDSLARRLDMLDPTLKLEGTLVRGWARAWAQGNLQHSPLLSQADINDYAQHLLDEEIKFAQSLIDSPPDSGTENELSIENKLRAWIARAKAAKLKIAAPKQTRRNRFSVRRSVVAA